MRERKLASIQKVIKIEPITFLNENWNVETAQAIEKITILGWHLVAKKWEFKIWDFCVYFEIDSFLPIEKPQYQFLIKSGTKKMEIENQEKEWIRLKTIKLKWVISQGLALPINIFPEIENIDLKEWLDVTEILGIYKYEAPIPASLQWMIRWDFPSFIPKTDEPRIQSNVEILEKYKNENFYITEKLDWSSITVFLKKKIDNETLEEYLDFWVCSRNLDLKEDDKNTYWKVTRKLKLEEILNNLYNKTWKEYAFQGELVWEGIQWNKLKIKWHTIYFYNIYNITDWKYLDFKDFKKLILSLDLNIVPIVYESHKLKFNNIDEIVEFSTVKSSINPNAWQEWYVFRSEKEWYDDKIWRISFKCISPMFLLKWWE